MAQRPRGMRFLENPVGSAPGLAFEQAQTRLYALPGVPGEMRAMFEGSVEPELRRAAAGRFLARRTLKVSGRSESAVDELLRDLYGSQPGVEVTILTAAEGIELQLHARGAARTEAARRLGRVEQRMRARLGLDLYGTDDDTLPAVLGRSLQQARSTVATAESCTAGLVAATLTEPAGSSSWFRGGLVVYDNRLKQRLAGVSQDTLSRHGAVSEAVARELARGARTRTGADFGIGVTGIAGPGGATPDKPVGRVHLAWSHATREWHRQIDLVGDRELIRRRTVAAALDGLRRELVEAVQPVDDGTA